MRSEYSFAGWSTTNGSGTIANSSSEDTTYEFVAADAAKNITFTASYTQNDIYISNAIADQIYNNTAKTPAITVKDVETDATLNTIHYTVAYTNNTAAGTATVTVSGAGHYEGQSDSKTFTIKYPEVTFHANDGTFGPTPPSKAYPKYGTKNFYTTSKGSTAYTFPVPTRSNLTFIGYANSQTATSANYITYNGSSFTVLNNWNETTPTKTLYAIWRATITFNNNYDGSGGGGNHATLGVIYNYSILNDPNVNMPTNPTRSGYNFIGWNTSSSATNGNVTQSTPITATDTWYAIWE